MDIVLFDECKRKILLNFIEKLIWFLVKYPYYFFVFLWLSVCYMKNLYFDSVVELLLKYKHKIIDIAAIRRICLSVMDAAYDDKKMYKLLYYLKNRWYLLTLKKNIYFVKLIDQEYTSDWLLDRFYWKLVKQHCKSYVRGNRYIGGLKALELHFAVYDIPDEIMIVNQEKQSTEVIMFDKKVLFKTYISNKKNLFSLYKKHIDILDLGLIKMPVVCKEIALLESLYNPSIVHKWYIDWLVKKFLKKYKSILDPDIWVLIVRNNKHHSSLNRLYLLAQQVDKKLAKTIWAIIKKYSYILE